MSRRAGGLLVSMIVSATAGSARADESDRDSGLAESVRHAQATLDEREARARVWQYGWGALGYGMAIGFGALAATTDDVDARIAFGFAAGGVFIDTTLHMLDSIEPNAASWAREHPGQALNQLRRAAEAEQRRQSLVFGHLLPAGAATVGGLVLWLGFGNLQGAVAATTAAVVTNELRILTQPRSAMAAWNAYRRGQSPTGAAQPLGAPAPSWSLAFTGAGCAVVGTF